MENKLETFLKNFFINHGEQNSADIDRIGKMDKEQYINFIEEIEYFMYDNDSYVREFAIDPVTLESIVCNRLHDSSTIAKKELLAKICLTEKLSTNEKNERVENFVSGFVFFDLCGFKTPILKIDSGNKNLSDSRVKEMILAAMESKRVIFLDFKGSIIKA